MISDYEMKVADAMNKKPISVVSTMRVDECARLMREKDIGSVIVQENSFLAGILTEQGMVHKIIARGLDPKQVRVGEIMKRKILTIEPQESVTRAFEIMARQDIRQLPVISEGRIVGIITRNDLIKIQPAMIAAMYERMYVVGNELKSPSKGYCEECGAYSKSLKIVGNASVCIGCRKEMDNANI
ncbi:MAG: cyclic nucleotide-binding/CBS domain-containing protein [Candidatus Woesearchaeota archaeon]